MKKKSKILVTFIQIVLIAVIIFSGIKIIEWIKSKVQPSQMMKKLDKPIKNDETCNVSSFLFHANRDGEFWHKLI